MAEPTVKTIGKYQILDRIASGHLAEIFKARLEGIGGFQRMFAIKRILPHLSQNVEYATMLESEARVSGLLNHGNIVQILDLGREDGSLYIVMEYVEGYDLRRVLEQAATQGRALPVPQSVFLVVELLKGLEYAHEREVMRDHEMVALNIVHRDVSPGNILVGMGGEVKLTDFGIARAALRVMETHPELVKRRFDYMSPEQAAGEARLDQRSDLFSVAVVLYEMLSGAHPFRRESEVETLQAIRRGEVVSLSDVAPDVPESLVAIVDKGLQVDREARFASAAAFKAALTDFLHEQQIIVSQASLAATMRALFDPSTPALSDPEPMATGPDPEDEAVSTPPDDSVVAMEDEDEIPPPAPHAHEWRNAAEGDEQDTVVMHAPDLEAEIAAARDRSAAAPSPARTASKNWDEAATVVRPRAAEQALAARQAVAIEEPDLMLAMAEPPEPPPNNVTSLIAGGVALLVGLLVGCLATLAFVASAGNSLGSPVLKVMAPDGAVVTLGGEPLLDAKAVPAGQPQHLEVRVPDHEPWLLDLTLSAGEYRLLVVSPATLRPTTKKGEGSGSP